MKKSSFINMKNLKILFIISIIFSINLLNSYKVLGFEIYSKTHKQKIEAQKQKIQNSKIYKTIEWCVGNQTFKSTENEYDQNGNIISFIQYDNKGNLAKETKYTYNNGLLTNMTTYSNNKSIISMTNYTYDNNNKLVLNKFNINSSEAEIYYSYDKDDCLIEKTYHNIQGNFKRKNLYKYDLNNNVIEDTYYYGHNQIGYRWAYAYDKNNNKVEYISYDNKDIECSKEIYKYDSNENLIRTVIFDQDNKVFQRILWIYDEKQDLLKEKSISNSFNKPHVRYFYEYLFYNKPSITYKH